MDAEISSQVMAVPVAPDKTGQLVPAERPAIVVDGPKADDAGTDGQTVAGSVRPAEFGIDHDNNICSDHIVCALRSLPALVLSVPEREEVASGRVLPASEADALDVSRKAMAPAARKDAPAGEDVIAPEDDQPDKTHLQVPPQETDLDYSWDPAAEPSSSSDTDGEDDLYNQGVAAAMAMDTKTLQTKVTTYFRQEANQEQRRQRRVAMLRNAAAANPAPAVKFSLRLSDEEATEDVEAVSVTQDVMLEAEVPALPRNAKRRRGG
jgi:hypothetical protein